MKYKYWKYDLALLGVFLWFFVFFDKGAWIPIGIIILIGKIFGFVFLRKKEPKLKDLPFTHIGDGLETEIKKEVKE